MHIPTINKVITSFVYSHIGDKSKIDPTSRLTYNYKTGEVKIVITYINCSNVDRSPCVTIVFNKNITDPNFFNDLKQCLDNLHGTLRM